MKEKQKSKIIFLIIAGLIIVNQNFALAAEDQGRLIGFRNAWMKIMNEADSFLRGLLYFKQIQEENNTLVFQNRALESLLIDYQSLKKENELLREALKIKKSDNFNFVLADIIGRSPLNFSQTFVINVGEQDGIKVGQPVVWGGKSLVGEIIDVRKNTSIVRSISDTEFKAAVLIGEKRIEGLLKGNGFLPLYIDLVPVDVEVNQNSKIYTSGLDNKFPKNLYIGDVSQVDKIEGKIFQDIKIEPALDWTKLYQVFVITNTN
ncbi:MAG: rod shape-determining protein MreC [Parcubacteria group bacterium]|jgi:rod shape-determining protein MreC|nr:rod shape-determining protein MreC [Parcubacteria group bacterium]